METKSNSNKTILNVSLVIISQLASVVSGIILPKIFLNYFGSETNGLIASITQFLSYISLIEGGLGSVYLARLYKPLVDNDKEKLSKVVKAGKSYFRIISFILIGYVAVLSAVYPLFVKTTNSYFFVFSLIYVLAINLFIQYGFSISYKLLLQADRKAYIPLLVQTAIIVANIVLTLIAVRLWPQVHFVKFISGALYLLQPIVFGLYVRKKYSLDGKVPCNAKEELPNRWSCFGQNVAFFVHQNTDVTVLTIFKGVILVSVYSVHSMITVGLRTFVMAFSQVFSPRVGRAIVKKNQSEIVEQVNDYEFLSIFFCTILFGACATVIAHFIKLYTSNLSDFSIYQRPIFAVILTFSEYLYCIRAPYAACVNGAGKFKETAISAYIEVAINVVLSIILVWKFELIGIVIATCCAMLFRLIYYILYSKRHIATSYSLLVTIKRFVISFAAMVIVYLLFTFINPRVETYYFWILEGFICVFLLTLIFLALSFLFDRKTLVRFVKKIFIRKKSVSNESIK